MEGPPPAVEEGPPHTVEEGANKKTRRRGRRRNIPTETTEAEVEVSENVAPMGKDIQPMQQDITPSQEAYPPMDLNEADDASPTADVYFGELDMETKQYFKSLESSILAKDEDLEVNPTLQEGTSSRYHDGIPESCIWSFRTIPLLG